VLIKFEPDRAENTVAWIGILLTENSSVCGMMVFFKNMIILSPFIKHFVIADAPTQ
jgi:hypothetical protein